MFLGGSFKSLEQNQSKEKKEESVEFQQQRQAIIAEAMNTQDHQEKSKKQVKLKIVKIWNLSSGLFVPWQHSPPPQHFKYLKKICNRMSYSRISQSKNKFINVANVLLVQY